MLSRFLLLLNTLALGNNTDGNKLVIFSGIALYYGDTYIVSPQYQAIPEKISRVCCCLYCYKCTARVTMPMATNE